MDRESGLTSSSTQRKKMCVQTCFYKIKIIRCVIFAGIYLRLLRHGILPRRRLHSRGVQEAHRGGAGSRGKVKEGKESICKNGNNNYCFLSTVCPTCWTSARAQRSTGLPAFPPVSSPSRATHQSQSAIIWTSGLPARYVIDGNVI